MSYVNINTAYVYVHCVHSVMRGIISQSNPWYIYPVAMNDRWTNNEVDKNTPARWTKIMDSR